MATNDMQMLPTENFSYQVTAVTSHCREERSLIAIAEQDFHDNSLLYFSIYEVGEGENG